MGRQTQIVGDIPADELTPADKMADTLIAKAMGTSGRPAPHPEAKRASDQGVASWAPERLWRA